MFLLKQSRATEHADLSPVNRTGFISPADPINCLVTDEAGYGEYVQMEDGQAVFHVDYQHHGGAPVHLEGQAAHDYAEGRTNHVNGWNDVDGYANG